MKSYLHMHWGPSVLTINPWKMLEKNANTRAQWWYTMCLALGSKGEEIEVVLEVKRSTGPWWRSIGPLWDGHVGLCWTLMVLGWEFCIDPLCFGPNMHLVCVALCISFPKCPTSSKSEFGANSYSHFSAQDTGSGPSQDLGSRLCHLGPDHVTLVQS